MLCSAVFRSAAQLQVQCVLPTWRACRFIKVTKTIAGPLLLFITAFNAAVRAAFQSSGHLKFYEALAATWDFNWID